MNREELIEKLAEQVMRMPKGYIGIQPVYEPEEYQRHLKYAKATINGLLPIFAEFIKGIVLPRYDETMDKMLYKKMSLDKKITYAIGVKQLQSTILKELRETK